MNQYEAKLIFNDPIYKKIIINDPLIIALIKSEEMQRLKKIKQLGTISLLEKKISHTRFEHSLGMYHVICQTLKKPSFNHWSLKKKQEIAISGLLHDIGHGPLSHVFEKLFLKFEHEEYSAKIIKNKKGNIYNLLKKANLNITRICDLITKKNHQDLGKFFISHQFDFDRVDYLLRDSYYLNFKKKISYQTLINHLDFKKNHLVFDAKIINVLEKFLNLRIQIREKTFWKKQYLLCEKILKKIFQRLRFLKRNKKININNSYFQFLWKRSIPLKTFLKWNDQNFMTFINQINKQSDDFVLKTWINKVLGNKISKKNISSSLQKKYFSFKYNHNILIYKVDKKEILIFKNGNILKLSDLSKNFNKTKYFKRHGKLDFFN